MPGEKLQIRFAEIAVSLPVDQTYHYSIPSSLPDIRVGSIVLVPFGKRRVTGFVVGLSGQSAVKKVRDVISIVDEMTAFGEETLNFYKEISKYYMAPLGEVIRMALPPGLNKKSEICIRGGRTSELGFLAKDESELLEFLNIGKPIPFREANKKFNLQKDDFKRLEKRGLIEFFTNIRDQKTKGKFESFIKIAEGVDLESLQTRSKKEREVLEYLKNLGVEIRSRDLREIIPGAEGALRRLKDKGYITILQRESERTPFLESVVKKDTPPELFEDQKNALLAIESSILRGTHQTFLLYGITGSGKTEVYLRVIEKVLEKGKTALALVPEIALTPQFIRRFRARFGEIISVLHSSMSHGERYDQWRKILRGDAKIVIGARSAIFAPLKNIGVVVVDEEHDQSYKQDDRIMYNARDLALIRGKLSNTTVVLGSATPSLETYYKAFIGEYKLLNLFSRTLGFGLPEVEIVDLKKEKGKLGKKGFLSERLLSAIRENSEVQGKTILFLNRRGFSSFVICMTCGVSIKCPNCSVSLKYHDEKSSLICHYCYYSVPLYGFCQTCGSKSLWRAGFGTEQLEKEIKSHFPDLKVERMDRDTTQKKFAHEKIINRLEAGEIDVLIGTQMVAKGLDARKVTLVGVVLADISLNLPDFRACEKTFSLLTQVAGRSGRGEAKGKVIIQTYNPEHYCVQDASKHDYVSFFEKEITFVSFSY